MKDLMGSHRMILLFQIFDLNIPKMKTKHLALFFLAEQADEKSLELSRQAAQSYE